MSSEGRIPAIEGAHLLQSLRASDFDIPSAIGELIDNSIQADAKTVNIKVKDVVAGTHKKYKLIQEIVCADDGYGMDATPGSTLHSCIKLGYSTRFNNRDGIGRFGVGMTLAGIRFATKIEVYSKQKGKKWNYIIFDLNNDEDINEGIAPPVEKEPPAEYLTLVGKSEGTLVIWSGFDKFAEQDLHATTYSDGFEAPDSLDPYGYLNHWIGRTYRKFIWQGVKINLNDQEVYSFDPLFISKQKNQFPEDPKAKIIFEKEIDWNVSHNGKKGGSETSKIKIKISLLPEFYRENISKGGLQFKGRYIEENQGISILRSDREVYYDEIPYFGEGRVKKLNWEDKDRWWGCEISFTPELDEHFTVKNIKRGAVPAKELKIALYSLIKPVRDACIEQVQAHWARVKANQERGKFETGTDIKTTHATAETLAKTTKIPEKPKAGKNLTPAEQENRLENLTRELDETDAQKWRVKFESQPFTIMDGHWKGDTFIDMNYLEGKAILQYNLNHVFFEEMSNIRKQLQNMDDPTKAVKLAQKLHELIDILLMSFVRARQGFDEDSEYSVKQIMEYTVRDWGRYLHTYTRAYEKEHLFEEDV
ncbi:MULTISPECIES: ATP-binding protein [unclassified Methanoregula]|uniref:ATP-binding protein n=1 Tax=unclassified Methanoregula TaxID=2649730 RepID=UPI0009D57B7A|nr:MULTISPECIES: ATP-binding protein [unclassified Methanoregula]OPX62210.1 MAG: hypothetical protein A4E33_02476 [Methanoregula sp. PtaB.Bin085]OPY35581.1 MAG: hypothetical protein A4E34_00581 [Methanoregula sp. PtaU1.Bin006]